MLFFKFPTNFDAKRILKLISQSREHIGNFCKDINKSDPFHGASTK